MTQRTAAHQWQRTGARPRRDDQGRSWRGAASRARTSSRVRSGGRVWGRSMAARRRRRKCASSTASLCLGSMAVGRLSAFSTGRSVTGPSVVTGARWRAALPRRAHMPGRSGTARVTNGAALCVSGIWVDPELAGQLTEPRYLRYLPTGFNPRENNQYRTVCSRMLKLRGVDSCRVAGSRVDRPADRRHPPCAGPLPGAPRSASQIPTRDRTSAPENPRCVASSSAMTRRARRP